MSVLRACMCECLHVHGRIRVHVYDRADRGSLRLNADVQGTNAAGGNWAAAADWPNVHSTVGPGYCALPIHENARVRQSDSSAAQPIHDICLGYLHACLYVFSKIDPIKFVGMVLPECCLCRILSGEQ